MSKIWTPSVERCQHTHLYRFMQHLPVSVTDIDALYDWSIKEKEKFWSAVWDYTKIIGTKGKLSYQFNNSFENCRFFPEGTLNFAENLLRTQGDTPAIIFWGENQIRQTYSHTQLYKAVAALAAAFKNIGVQAGDRIVGVMPNCPQAIIAALAAASLGAVWAACSPDFGYEGIMDRLEQLNPTVFVSVNGYLYNGKENLINDRLERVLNDLPLLKQAICYRYLEHAPIAKGMVDWQAFIKPFEHVPMVFEQFPFNHPLFILFSSGTTGKPKCIIHGAGGTLIQLLKEHQLHCDIQPQDRLFYFTTCSWMMWHWQLASLASGATLVLYDGSPLTPDPEILFKLIAQEKVTLFGTSAKYIDSICKLGMVPKDVHDLSTVRTICSTGSPLVAERFDYVYTAIKPDVHLASISGGTDILSCFALGNPMGPVLRGELQMRGLGMAVEVFDETGQSVVQQKGDLVCTQPFPSMPLGFWNDTDQAKFKATYFERYPNLWHHGDFVELTPTNGLIIYGRSDTVLKPGGVRIGTAEIYRQVESIPEIEESVAVGQEWDNDIRVVLFVKMRLGCTLDTELKNRIKETIRTHTTPRHVPAKIIAVADIPKTKNGKITELAVREVIHHRKIANIHILANPDSLKLYEHIEELN